MNLPVVQMFQVCFAMAVLAWIFHALASRSASSGHAVHMPSLPPAPPSREKQSEKARAEFDAEMEMAKLLPSERDQKGAAAEAAKKLRKKMGEIINKV